MLRLRLFFSGCGLCIANRNSLACTDQFREIRIEAVGRESALLSGDVLRFLIACKHKTANLGYGLALSPNVT